MTDAERVRLDFALAEISTDPAIGAVSKHAAYREYARDGVRVLYVPSALGTIIIWGSRNLSAGQADVGV